MVTAAVVLLAPGVYSHSRLLREETGSTLGLSSYIMPNAFVCLSVSSVTCAETFPPRCFHLGTENVSANNIDRWAQALIKHLKKSIINPQKPFN